MIETTVATARARASSLSIPSLLPFRLKMIPLSGNAFIFMERSVFSGVITASYS